MGLKSISVFKILNAYCQIARQKGILLYSLTSSAWQCLLSETLLLLVLIHLYTNASWDKDHV